MNVLFLDINGVLNDRYTTEKTPLGFDGVDDDKLIILKKICDNFDYRLVLSSDWRDCLMACDEDGKYLVDRLHQYGMYLYGCTPSIKSFTRAIEIKKYLEVYGNIIQKYIVLDDFPFDFNTIDEIGSHVIVTDYDNDDVTKIKGIMSVNCLDKYSTNNTVAVEALEVIDFINDIVSQDCSDNNTTNEEEKYE